MADDTTIREAAFQFALAIAEFCDEDVFCDYDISDMTDQVIASADKILAWLEPVGPAVQLVMHVGPVTEQL
jgi:hypothetical protein